MFRGSPRGRPAPPPPLGGARPARAPLGTKRHPRRARRGGLDRRLGRLAADSACPHLRDVAVAVLVGPGFGLTGRNSSERVRRLATSGCPTKQRRAISRSDHFDHSSSLRSIITACRLSAFDQRSPWVALAPAECRMASQRGRQPVAFPYRPACPTSAVEHRGVTSGRFSPVRCR